MISVLTIFNTEMSDFCPHSVRVYVYMYVFRKILKVKTITSPHNIHHTIFIMEAYVVIFEVRTEPLSIMYVNISLQRFSYRIIHSHTTERLAQKDKQQDKDKGLSIQRQLLKSSIRSSFY